MEFATFMAQPLGRGIRVVAGIILIVLGFIFGGALGWVLGIIGLVPIIVGLANVCLLAPLFGAPFRGQDIAR